MKTWLEKFFPQYDNEEIRNVIKIFWEVYEDIQMQVVLKVNNIIDEKQKQEVVYQSLRESFPWYNDALISALLEFILEKNDINKLEDCADTLLKKETSFALITPEYLQKDRNLSEFIKTAKAIWVLDPENESSSDLTDKNDLPMNNPSIYNYLENYKNWLGKKLLLTEDETLWLWVKQLEYMMQPYIELAIKHINTVFDWIEYKESVDLKSAYYENIHSIEQNISIFDLLKFYYKLEQNKKNAVRKYNSTDKSSSNRIVHLRYLNQIKIGQFEIQRIFALTTLYLNRENTLTFQNSKEEQDFLVSKLSDLWSDEYKDIYVIEWMKSDNLLYNYTITKELWWKYNEEKGRYIFSETPKDWFQSTKMDSFTMKWKYRNYETQEHQLQVLHVGSRVRKNPYSSTEKILRKNLSSYNEILDHKWFIFVVDNLKRDSKMLIKILENELGSLKTSWLEEPVQMNISWNNNTNSSYNSIKWTLKVNYKWKLIKDFFNMLSEIFESNEIRRLKNTIIDLKKSHPELSEIQSIESAIKKINNPDLKEIFKDLKEKFWNKKYFMEVEIQIFDKENYIKAEIDENSSAYHGKYKEMQTIETLPIYFPKSIYKESIRKVIINQLLLTEKYSHLKNNLEKQ